MVGDYEMSLPIFAPFLSALRRSHGPCTRYPDLLYHTKPTWRVQHALAHPAIRASYELSDRASQGAYSPLSYVLVVDLRDAFFQRSPFADLPPLIARGRGGGSDGGSGGAAEGAAEGGVASNAVGGFDLRVFAENRQVWSG